MRINPEDRGLQGLSTFIGMVGLNLMYLVACIPIITIGAATTALYEVMIRFSDEESGRPVRDYFPTFARNFVRGTALWLTFLVPILLLAVVAIFWSGSPLVFAWGAMALAILAAGYFLAAALYSFALTAVYTDSYRRTVKNALLLPAAHPVRTFGILAIPIAVFALTFIMPPFWIVIVTIGFSVGAYATAFIFRGTFAAHSPETNPDGQA